MGDHGRFLRLTSQIADHAAAALALASVTAALAFAVVVLALSCATPARQDAQGPVIDPVGAYGLTMSSESQVSEGWMSINGQPGAYTGRVVVGGTVAAIRFVEVGPGQLNVRAAMPSGTLILRLTGDAEYLSGNWVLGSRRGTITATKRRQGPGAGQGVETGSG